MDDLNRLFALIEVIQDPAKAKKVADDLKALEAKRSESIKAFKDVKYATQESEKRLKQIASQRDALREKAANVSRREAACDAREKKLSNEAREVEKRERAERQRLSSFQEDLDAREAKVSKREKDMENKARVLGAREDDIKQRASALATAVTRASGVRI
jgi:uncharacterized protein (DUF3084 family)